MIEKMRHDDSAHVAYGLRLRAENATLAELLEEFHRNAVMAADLAAKAQRKQLEAERPRKQKSAPVGQRTCNTSQPSLYCSRGLSAWRPS